MIMENLTIIQLTSIICFPFVMIWVERFFAFTRTVGVQGESSVLVLGMM